MIGPLVGASIVACTLDMRGACHPASPSCEATLWRSPFCLFAVRQSRPPAASHLKLTHYLASVALVQFLFPSRRRESWIGTRKLWGCLIGLVLWTPAIMSVQILADDPEFQLFFPPVGFFFATLGGIGLCILLARVLPGPTVPDPMHSVPRPLAFGVVGAVTMLVVFLTVFAVPEWGNPPPLAASFLFVLALDAATIWLIAHWSGNLSSWNDRHVFALVAGQLSFFAVFAVLTDFDEGFTGKSLVGMATAYALWRVWRSISSRRITTVSTDGEGDPRTTSELGGPGTTRRSRSGRTGGRPTHG